MVEAAGSAEGASYQQRVGGFLQMAALIVLLPLTEHQRKNSTGRQREYAAFGCNRSAGTLHRLVIATCE